MFNVDPAVHVWTAKYELSTDPISVDRYVSPDYYRMEKERLFKKSWLLIGREDEIPAAGDFFVRELEAADTSILVSRDRSGNVRAFHNMCRHRGNKVSFEACGTVEGFVCPFHGWTYGLDGKLIYVPDQEDFFDLDRSRLGLVPVHVDQWEGFIFVNLDGSPTASLSDHLGEIEHMYDGYFNALELVSQYSWEMDINWKLFIDVSVEGYHGPHVHRDSIADQFCETENPNLNLPSIRLYRTHRTVSIPADFSRVPKPLEALVYRLGATSSYTPTKDLNLSQGLPPGVNPDRLDAWAFDILSLTPNVIFLTGRGVCVLMHMWPLGPGRTRVESRVYLDPSSTMTQRICAEYTATMLRDVIREDSDTLEPIQKMLESGTLTEMQLSDQEIACRHFHLVIDRLIGAGPAKAAAPQAQENMHVA